MDEENRDTQPTSVTCDIDPKGSEQADGVNHQDPDVFGNLEPTEHVGIFVRSRDDVVIKIAHYRRTADDQREDEPIVTDGYGFQKLSSKWLEFSLGFFEAAPLLEGMADYLHMSKAKEETLEFLKEVALRSVDKKSDQDDVEENIYVLNKRDIGVFNQRLAELVRFQRQAKVYTESFILSLVAQYEAMVADVLRLALASHPRIYISSDTKVNAVEVISSKDIEEIKKKIIEEKLEGLLRDSHINLVQGLFKKLSLDSPDKKLLKEFGEICERRNLITHAGGVVNTRYVTNLKALGFSEGEIPKSGVSLTADVRYIVKSNARITLLGFWTIHSVWRKLFPKESETADTYLNDAVHDFLTSGYTKMARRLCLFALNEFADIKEPIRAYLVVNLCLSYLLEEGMDDEVRRNGIGESLQMRDWGILNPSLALALCCINEDYNKIPEKIDDAVRDGLTVQEFSTWALFSKVRLLPLFQDKMMEHFGVVIVIDDDLSPGEHSDSSIST